MVDMPGTRHKGTAGAIILLLVLLVLFAYITMVIVQTRFLLGRWARLVVPNFTPTPQEAEILNILDASILAAIWCGYIIIVIAIILKVFKVTKEGTIKKV